MSLFAELKRRNVFRVAAAYLVAGWLLVEATSLLMDIYGAPEWVPKMLVGLLALGFPITLFFAWAFEITPEGVKREAEVDRSVSTSGSTGKRLDIITISLLVVALGLFLTEGFWRTPAATEPQAEVATQQEAIEPVDQLVSVAVLPFANMSADAENEYFADGISEEILNLLSGVRDLSVASRTSAFAFKGTSASVPDIATALGVRYVLEGSVRKSGQQVRITAQLIDASNDRHLWSETYDRTLDDIFAIQDEIAEAIGQALQVQLLGDTGQRVVAETIDPEVYAEFLEARYQLRRRSHADIIAALTKLQDVSESEPGFARGHAVLAEAYLLAVLTGTGVMEREQGFALAREHAEIARSMDDRLAVSYQVLGLLTGAMDRDLVSSMRFYRQAIALEPNEAGPHHWLGIGYAVSGYFDQALVNYTRALELAPDNANIAGNIASALLVMGRVDEALAMADRQAAFGNPLGGLQTKAIIELVRGDFAAAEAGFARYRELTEQAGLGPIHAALVAAARDPGEVPRLLETLEELEPGENSAERLEDLIAVSVHAPVLYEEILHRLTAESYLGGAISTVWMPELAEMRADPRFIEYLEMQGYLGPWQEYGPPPGCRAEGGWRSCGHGSD